MIRKFQSIIRAGATFIAAGALSLSAYAGTACPQHFVNGQPPQFTNPKLASKTTAICYEAFGLMHSGATRTPLWSAEHLTRDNMLDAKSLSRENSFHPD